MGLKFLNLPVEIRREILGDLLTIHSAPRQGPVTGEAHSFTCKDCRPLARGRDELRGSGFIQAEILLVCRQLYREGQILISDNHFVTVRRPQRLGDSLLSQLRLGHWKVASGIMPKLRPIMLFSIEEHGWNQHDSPSDLLLFDLRDLALVVRYLLHTCRAYAFGRVLDVCINKTHVLGYCNRNNAARELFLDTVWPWLNKEIGTITLEYNKACILLHQSEPQVVGHTKPGQLLEPVEMNPTLETIFNGVQPDPNVPRTGGDRGWDFRATLTIWRQRVMQIFDLSRSGSWLLPIAWEVLAHDTLHTLDDQGHCQFTASALLQTGNWEEVIFPELVRLHFCSALICLNLAYAHPKHNYLQRTPAELNRQALCHISSLESLPMKRDHGQSTEACCLYTRIAFVEAWARANRLRKAWYMIYLAFLALRPNDGGSGWAQAQVRRGHMLKQKYMVEASREGEDGNERWIKDSNFRARFFRGYTRTEIVPLIKRKFGEDAGAFFRDAVPRKLSAWIRKHKGSLQRTRR